MKYLVQSQSKNGEWRLLDMTCKTPAKAIKSMRQTTDLRIRHNCNDRQIRVIRIDASGNQTTIAQTIVS